MAYLSKKKYEEKLARIRMNNLSTARKRKLRAERFRFYPKISLPSTSKLLLWTAVLLCVEIIWFCEYAFAVTKDTSFLYVLAGVPATLVPTIMSYYYKSKCENTAGGIVYETAMSQREVGGNDEAVG